MIIHPRLSQASLDKANKEEVFFDLVEYITPSNTELDKAYMDMLIYGTGFVRTENGAYSVEQIPQSEFYGTGVGELIANMEPIQFYPTT